MPPNGSYEPAPPTSSPAPISMSHGELTMALMRLWCLHILLIDQNQAALEAAVP